MVKLIDTVMQAAKQANLILEAMCGKMP